VKATPVAASAVGLVIVKVRLVVPPGRMALAPNAFVSDGATPFKVAVAEPRRTTAGPEMTVASVTPKVRWCDSPEDVAEGISRFGAARYGPVCVA
jgi:hypothetical protein